MIGVDDDGVALGLENDYASLKGDRDDFELHLRNLLHREIGKPITAACVKVSFPAVQEFEICQIEVLRSSKPIMLKIKDKNGVSKEKVYIRSGNSSQELAMSEFNEYQKGRFE